MTQIQAGTAVELTRPDEARACRFSRVPPRDIGIDVTAWEQGRAPRRIGLEDARSADGLLCFVVDSEGSADATYRALKPICGEELSLPMIEDLTSRDDMPRVREYSAGRIRKVSAFGVRAEVLPDDAGAQPAAPGRLVFSLVEFLANHRWLIVCGHQAHSFVGADDATPTGERGCTELLNRAAARWSRGGLSSSGDLGVLMLYELTCSYSKARRTLLTWLERWELQCYRSNDSDPATLVSLRGLAAEFRARLNALNQPRDDAADGWFTRVTDARLAAGADRHIDRSLDALDRLSDMLRSSFELVHSQRTAEQLRLQQQQADRTEKLQEKLEKITSIFLVPTLVAGFFGANTALPGGNDARSWMGFELMVGSMVVGSIVVYFGMSWIRDREKRRLVERDGAEAESGLPAPGH
ncbi:MAG TPA: CorA family divalent cation transporter [Thermoleophilaceae bacterium]|jgi:hypothetical protein